MYTEEFHEAREVQEAVRLIYEALSRVHEMEAASCMCDVTQTEDDHDLRNP